MKKVLSLILSCAIVLGIAGFTVSAADLPIGFSGEHGNGYVQGDVITAQVVGIPLTAQEIKDKVDSGEATATVKVTSGASYVEGYKCQFDVENNAVMVEIQTKKEYQAIVSERLAVEFTLKIKGGDTYQTSFETILGWDEFSAQQVSDVLTQGSVLKITQDASKKTADNSQPVVITKDTNEAVASMGDFEGKTLNLGFGDIARVSVKFSKAQKSMNLYWDTQANSAVEDANPDIQKSYFNVRGENSFVQEAQVTLYADSNVYGDNPFLYSIDKDGKLTAIKTTVKDGTITFETKSLGSYVLSKSALKSGAGSGSEEKVNPGTGDFDNMLPIAMVLAVVSLAVAGVVGFRRVGKSSR